MEPEPTVKPAACVALLAVIATLLATAAQADSHDRDEQLIHSLIVFDGSGYSRTFSAGSSDTIYLLADTDNFVTLRKTFVYYRPADDALNTDTTHLDAVVDGFARDRLDEDRPCAILLQMEDYTYYNLRGDGAARWRTATGPDAHRVYADYQEKLRARTGKAWMPTGSTAPPTSTWWPSWKDESKNRNRAAATSPSCRKCWAILPLQPVPSSRRSTRPPRCASTAHSW